MKTAAVIPVKTFMHAKTRLGLPREGREELCAFMLEEMLQTLRMSPAIDEILVVTGEKRALAMSEKFGAVGIPDEAESGVNDAIVLADRYLLESGFDASIILPQDIPYIRTQDIDFMMRYAAPPNFAVIVPSRKFDGTNALVRMPVDIMRTYYDEDSYRRHMSAAKKCTPNAALVFVKRVMWDIDDMEDVEFVLQQGEKPHVSAKISEIAGTGPK